MGLHCTGTAEQRSRELGKSGEMSSGSLVDSGDKCDPQMKLQDPKKGLPVPREDFFVGEDHSLIWIMTLFAKEPQGVPPLSSGWSLGNDRRPFATLVGERTRHYPRCAWCCPSLATSPFQHVLAKSGTLAP